MKKVAFLIPTHQGDNPIFLKDAIESVLEQEVDSSIEIHPILCVDGRPPLDLETLEYPKKIFIRKIYNTLGRGLPSNLNCAITLINNEGYDYIARLDSDDLCFPYRVRSQVSYLEKNPNVDALGSYAIIIDENSREFGTKTVPRNVTFRNLSKGCQMIHPSVIFRGDFFRRFGLYDPALLKSQDWDLWLRSTKLGAHLENLETPLIKFRATGDLYVRRKKEQVFNLRLAFRHIRGSNLIYAVARSILIYLVPAKILMLFHKLKSQ